MPSGGIDTLKIKYTKLLWSVSQHLINNEESLIISMTFHMTSFNSTYHHTIQFVTYMLAMDRIMNIANMALPLNVR